MVKAAFTQLSKLGPLGCGVLLLVAMVVVCGISLPLANHWNGTTGMEASAAAALVCWAGGGLALGLVGLLQPWIGVAYAALVGMNVRLILALAVGAAWQFNGGSLASAGAVYYLIVFYQVALLIETSWFAARLSAASA